MTVHVLPASEQTVRVGVIDRSYAPILEIEDGDELVLETWGLWGNAVAPGMTFDDIVELKKVHAGKGPHSLTGPVAVRGARAGMLLRVDILDLEPGPYGFNLITPPPHSRGLLTEEFPYGEIRHFRLDTRHMETELVPGIPADDETHISSIPGEFGGNIDCPALVAGTTLFLPVWADQALFYAGDAHAMQGCGEVNQTALETTMERAHLRLSLARERYLHRPHAITRDYLVTMGFHTDLRQAAVQAVGDMVTWLSHDRGLTRSDAYVLCSLQADLMITQAVNGNNGVHACLSKQLFAFGE